MNKTKFIILSTPRTGSTYLVKILQSHPDVDCHYEQFIVNPKSKLHKPFEVYYKPSLLKYFKYFFSRLKLTQNYLNELKSNSHSHFGFKLMLSQLEKQKQLLQIARLENYKIIILKRRNLLNQYISLLHAQKSKIWHTEHDIVPVKFTLDINSLESRLAWMESENYKMDKYFEENESLTVFYEDLVGTESQLYHQRVLKFLNLKEEILHTEYKKILSTKLQDVVINDKEVESFLAERNYLS